MSSSDMALVIPGEQGIGEAVEQPAHRPTWTDVSLNSIAGKGNPFSLFTAGFNDHGPPTKVSRDGSPSTAVGQSIDACVDGDSYGNQGKP